MSVYFSGMLRFRFAPSPNGRLHLGHAYSALLNQRLAAKAGGQLLLRLEDIDTQRCTPALAAHCLEDLRWLGLAWEEPVRVQSEHWGDYASAAQQLKQQGLLYPCFCTRSQIAQHASEADPDGAPLYPGTCRGLAAQDAASRMAAGESHGWRLDMAKAVAAVPAPLYYRRFDEEFAEDTVVATPARWGDVVLVRKDTPTSYHLSVVVDDALQGISHVVRGQDLEAATDLHVLLQVLLGVPTPRYHHHGLLTDEAGKLSKSKASQSLGELRALGVSGEAIRAMLAL